MKIKFFYDNFSPEDVCGMYSLEHIISIVLFFALLAFLLFLSRNMTLRAVRKLHFIVACALSVGEIVRDTIQIIKGNVLDSWLPLFYCSLFMYAMWLAYFKQPFVRALGFSFVTMGAAMAGVTFTFYPSTSLVWYPIWHPLSIYGFIYHLVMTYCGILFVIKGYFKPRVKNSLHYLIFISIACGIGSIFNIFCGTNCMFLRDPMNLPIFADIAANFPLLWAFLAFLGQGIIMYWINYGLLTLYRKFSKRAREISDSPDVLDDLFAGKL